MATTPNMHLTIPIPGITLGPQYATNINSDLGIIDRHNHTDGKGEKIPPDGLNISADLTFNSNNAIDLRSDRYINFPDLPSFDPQALDKCCALSIADNFYFIDGQGNVVQITKDGGVYLGNLTSLTLADDQFTLEYFSNTRKKLQFSAINVPLDTTNIYALPAISGTSDTLVSNSSTSTMINKTLTDPAITQITSGSYTYTLPVADGVDGQVLVTNGFGVWSFRSTTDTFTQLNIDTSTGPFNNLPNDGTLTCLTGSTPTSITGIIAGNAGQPITILNESTAKITLVNNSSSLGAGAKSLILSDLLDYVLQPNAAVQFQYDSTNKEWRQLATSSITEDVSSGGPYSNLPSDSAFIRLNDTAPYTVTGIAVGYPGQIITVYNLSPYIATFSHLSGSAVGSQLYMNGQKDILIQATTAMTFQYDSLSGYWTQVSSGLGTLTLPSASSPFVAIDSTTSLVRIDGSTDSVISGISEGASGQLIVVRNASSGMIGIQNLSVAAASTDRIYTPSGVDYKLAPNSSVTLTYDTTNQVWTLNDPLFKAGQFANVINPPGYMIGEITEAAGAGTPIAPSSTVNNCSMALGVGDWDIFANVYVSGTITGTTASITSLNLTAGVSFVSGTFGSILGKDRVTNEADYPTTTPSLGKVLYTTATMSFPVQRTVSDVATNPNIYIVLRVDVGYVGTLPGFSIVPHSYMYARRRS